MNRETGLKRPRVFVLFFDAQLVLERTQKRRQTKSEEEGE